MSASSGEEPLGAGTALAYAAPAFALAVAGVPVYVYAPKFYADVVGVELGRVGALLLGVRLFDAVTDPLVGSLSDRWSSPWGRRRPWILLGALPLVVALTALFSPPAALSPGAAAAWLGASLLALFAAWTVVAVPYESLGVELTRDYDARGRLLALRDGALIAGTVFAACAPALVGAALGLEDGPAGERARFRGLAALYAPLLLGACAVCALRCRERPAPATLPPRVGWGESWRALAGNRPFLVLTAAYTVAGVGSNLPATLIAFYVEHVLGSGRTGLFLVLYLATGALCLPLWLPLARRFDRKRAWLAAMTVNTGAFLGVLFLGPGDELAYGALVVLSGVGFGATMALPSAMQADVTDYHELLTGERREGQLVGVSAIAKKLAAALGIGLALPLLGWAGYRAGQAQQPPQVLLALRALYAGVPCACNLLAMLLVARGYPLDRAEHARILAALAARRAQGAPA